MPRLSKKASKKAKRSRMHEAMSRYKHGALRSGSKKNKRRPVVMKRKQAIAIALSESGQSKKSKQKKHHRKGYYKR